MNIHDFDAIRPILPEELSAAIEELFADPQFCAIVPTLMKGIPLEALKAKALQCKDNLEFQKVFFYPLVQQLMSQLLRLQSVQRLTPLYLTTATSYSIPPCSTYFSSTMGLKILSR